MRFFLLQKRPDGQSAWDDLEGETYNFARRLPGAKQLCKNDFVLFYRPLQSGTTEDGAIYAAARVGHIEFLPDGTIDASLVGFRVLTVPVPLEAVGDPRANNQHSFQKVDRQFALDVFERSGTRIEELG